KGTKELSAEQSVPGFGRAAPRNGPSAPWNRWPAPRNRSPFHGMDELHYGAGDPLRRTDGSLQGTGDSFCGIGMPFRGTDRSRSLFLLPSSTRPIRVDDMPMCA